ncbi:AAA family ATPase [Psychrobacter jeotgali]|uniref:AAA family ATPase n=1 Tax=Psychrobacter jeotgali TaxID=179010 RepID=UPI00191A85D5|nr:AAA family ATPase [Psychrobacter jeotgali]
MRLKSLKLAGFKSFANSTTFTFPHGITAIVGPNGCGKSNVIDAIRWVLGETSAKQLRGGAMSDVIFAGTQDKAAKSVASVELTFEHTQDEQTGIRHEFNLYHELSVRRQVNMEGRSDYFINGTRARRRDVVDVFLGTGLGARSYAVIEQGMIGRIVDSSPLQLREFIEEAAGVSRYQARRDETQKKLEMTRDNLVRLQDMQSELTRQQKSLSKQAASAERYQALNESHADINQQLAIQQLYQAKETQLQLKKAHENSSAEVAVLQTDYDALKTKQDQLTDHINQEQWLKDDAQSAYHKQQLSYQQAEHQVNDVQAKVAQTKQQLADLAQQKTQVRAQIEQLKKEQDEQQTELASMQPQLIELTAKRESYKHNEQPLQHAWAKAQTELTTLEDSQRTLEQQQALNNQSKQRQQQSYNKWQKRQQNWQILWEQLQQPDIVQKNKAESIAEPAGTQIAALKHKLQQIERQQDSVDERLSELQPQAHIFQQRLTDEQRNLAELEKRHALLAGEFDTLHNVLHPKPINKASGKTSASAAIKKANNDADNRAANHNAQSLPISTLREQVELSPQGQKYANELDKLLSLWLDSHVLISDKLTQDALRNDRQSADNLGQALKGFLPDLLTYQSSQTEPGAQNAQNNSEAHHSLWLPAFTNSNQRHKVLEELPNELVDKVLPLSQMITQPALALWQRCYLYIEEDDNYVDKAQPLVQILKVLPASALLLTTDGWIMSGQGSLNLNKLLGAKDSTNNQFLTQRLQQRTRLEQLEDLLNDSDDAIQMQQKAIKKSQYEYDALRISLEETRAQSERLTREKYQYTQQLSTEQAEYARLHADIKRLNSDKAALEQEQQELVSEQQAIEDEQQRIQVAIDELIPKLVAAKENRQRLQEERRKLSYNRQADDDKWQALQLSLQKAQMGLEHHTHNLERATSAYDKALQNEQTLTTELKRIEQQLPDLQAALQSAQLARDEQQALLNERESTLNNLKHDYTQQQSELNNLENERQQQQSRLAHQATELALSEAKLTDASIKTQEALDNYYQMMNKDGAHLATQTTQKMSVSSLLTDFIVHERRVRPDKIAELQTELRQLEQQISKIGAVNLAAIKELDEVNERLEPLTQQIDDISASMQTLLDAIAAIDETTKTLFMETLDAVNDELAKLFAKVFGGGKASLTLNTDAMPDDIPENRYQLDSKSEPKSEQWRAGLTLMAQPKGKRNSRLAVLSGGEKTLTALSLIFAIFKQHPAPFCVLDEVDAPLDDANVARFTSLIHELADDLQFIFISHNKLSMQIADELKGITMPTAGISTLVSVSLDEAAHYIES